MLITHEFNLENVPKRFVYGWKRNNTFLYIGTSTSGGERVRRHNLMNRVACIKSGDSLILWISKSPEDVFALEALLIFKFKPVFNTKVYSPKTRDIKEILYTEITSTEKKTQINFILKERPYPVPKFRKLCASCKRRRVAGQNRGRYSSSRFCSYRCQKNYNAYI